MSLARSSVSSLRAAERVGAVDVAGPDPAGWVVLRFPGMSWPVAGRTVEPVPAGPRPAGDPTESAADPVTAALAVSARRNALVRLAVPAWFAVTGGVAVAVGLTAGDRFFFFLFFGVCLVSSGVSKVVRALPSARAVARLPKQLAAAPWTAYEVRLDPWQAPLGSATATGRLTKPDGHVVGFELPRAGYDLLATVAATGTMHVAGTPRRGAELPVGVPERPVLGYARFTAAATRR